MTEKTNYVGGKEASKILGVHYNTLYKWEKEGLIDVLRNKPNGKRYYNVEKYLKAKGIMCKQLDKKEIRCT